MQVFEEIEHKPSGHFTGAILSQLEGDKHSPLSAKHLPSQHKIGVSEGHDGCSGQSSGFLLHVLSKHLYGASLEHVIWVPQVPIPQLPSGQGFNPEGQFWKAGQFSTESLHELSQHFTGLSFGHIIPVGQEAILLAHEKSNWQRISLFGLHTDVATTSFGKHVPFILQFPS